MTIKIFEKFTENFWVNLKREGMYLVSIMKDLK